CGGSRCRGRGTPCATTGRARQCCTGAATMSVATRMAVVAVAAGVLLATALAVVAPTRAAWTDEVFVSAQASAGDWAPTPLGPIYPGNDDTVIQSITWDIPNTFQACATVVITG